MSSIGGDQEALRRDADLLRKEQVLLKADKQEIYDNLKCFGDNTNGVGKKLSLHKAQLSGMHHEFAALERSLLSANERVSDRDKALSREKSRVATLENFIKNHSSKAHRQSSTIQQKQIETISKIDAIYDHISNSCNDSQAALRAEVSPALQACLETLSALSKKETLEPAHFTQIDASIQGLSSQ